MASARRPTFSLVIPATEIRPSLVAYTECYYGQSKIITKTCRTTNLLSKLGHLLGSQAGVGEHANLGCDMAPVVLAAELLEVLLEESAHGDDAVGHALDLTEPLLVEGRIVQDLRSDAGTVNGRVGVQRADKDLDLGVDALLLLGRLADDGEGTDTLAVKTLS